MKFPDHALLNKTQIIKNQRHKKSIAVFPGALAIVFGAARIVAERFD
jgi:hypothetical protein